MAPRLNTKMNRFPGNPAVGQMKNRQKIHVSAGRVHSWCEQQCNDTRRLGRGNRQMSKARVWQVVALSQNPESGIQSLRHIFVFSHSIHHHF